MTQLQIFDRIMINPAGLGCTTIARNLDPLIKENPFDKAQRDAALEAISSSPGSLRRQRERSYVTNLRKAREDWEKAIDVKWSSGNLLTLTEEQMLYTASFIPAFDLLRKTWGKYLSFSSVIQGHSSCSRLTKSRLI